MKILWVLVNCNTIKEADAIGKEMLRRRLASCFDIFPRLAARYFWPPGSGKIETAKGCLLILETLPRYFKRIEKTVSRMYSDTLPFIGSVEIGNVSPRYAEWMRGELTR